MSQTALNGIGGPLLERLEGPPMLRRDDARIGLPVTFGRYTLVRRIGQGGWATVYEAWQTTEQGRFRVALKRLERPGKEAEARLAEEAELGWKLDSPRVVRLIEHGKVDGVPYLALEFVDGPDLATLIHRVKARRQQLSTEALLEILIQVGLSLRVAHTWLDPQKQKIQPILHCDLKPSNILLGRDGNVRLIDFGVARQGDWLPEAPEGLLGTMGYVAPERVLLEQAPPLSPATDLFSLGVIAYELCTLQSLFNGTPAQIIQQLLQAERFIPVALARLPQELHPRLRQVLERLLAPTPELRYAHVDDALRPLQELKAQLQLRPDLASFLSPYLEPGLDEESPQRVTDTHLVRAERARSGATSTRLGMRDARFPLELSVPSHIGVTHLSRAQLRALMPPVRPRPLILASVQAEESRRKFYLGLQILAGLCVAILGGLLVYWSLPVKIAVKSTPESALVSMQPGCDGEWSASLLSPASLRTRGPWPVCVALEAPGHIRLEERVLQPSRLRRSSVLDVSLEREVCVQVGSRPTGLPVYVDNQMRGLTGLEDLKVCGLTPFEPYVVQVAFDGLRWDVSEVSARPGELVKVFQDFSAGGRVSASPYERCQRYFASKEYGRAIELCRVAVVESPVLEQKIDALVIQGESFAAQDDVETACDLFGVALDRAVSERQLALERRVSDVRAAYDCEAVERARALREAEEQSGEAEEEETLLISPSSLAAPPPALPLAPVMTYPSTVPMGGTGGVTGPGKGLPAVTAGVASPSGVSAPAPEPAATPGVLPRATGAKP